jgi:hypothetical protein
MLLIFSVSMLTVGTRFSVSPAKTGVALSYILSIQQVGINASVILPCTQQVLLQAFGFVVRQLAEVENDMNSVERIVCYCTPVILNRNHLTTFRKENLPLLGLAKETWKSRTRF